MDMVMLDLMYTPTDNLTLMVMPHYMRHTMTMVGIDPMAGSGGGGTPVTEAATCCLSARARARHRRVRRYAGFRVLPASRKRSFGAHATLSVWVPTGQVDLKNADDSFVHYGMQSGSGTWDIEPSLTVTGRAGQVGWGAQGSYRWRTEERNASGFAFGDKARATGWASYLLTSDVGTTARLEYVHEGKVLGHYNGAHKHTSPPDRQADYGGETVSAGFGLNWLLPVPLRAGRN